MNPIDAGDLEVAQAAALAAGAAIMEHFGADPVVRLKGPDQPVTVADLAADRILRDRLTAARPDYGWLSEESAASPDRLSRRRVWVIDPIDGTNSFIEGRPEFVVSIGLVEQGAPVLGVLFNPVTEEMYHARAGAGAFRNDARIWVAPPPSPGERPVLLASRWEIQSGAFDAYRDHWQVTPMGSTAYRMLLVADGRGHATFSRRGKSEWDVCAAHLVVAEAGGEVRQVDGRSMEYNQPEPRFRGVVAHGVLDVDPAVSG